MSREILHDLLREELGFTGLVVTDALEMKAISAGVGVEEGAVRAIAAGADALCLGHDLFDESVVAVRRRARRSRSLGANLRGAPRRRGDACPAARVVGVRARSSAAPVDREAGLAAARSCAALRR